MCALPVRDHLGDVVNKLQPQACQPLVDILHLSRAFIFTPLIFDVRTLVQNWGRYLNLDASHSQVEEIFGRSIIGRNISFRLAPPIVTSKRRFQASSRRRAEKGLVNVLEVDSKKVAKRSIG